MAVYCFEICIISSAIIVAVEEGGSSVAPAGGFVRVGGEGVEMLCLPVGPYCCQAYS